MKIRITRAKLYPVVSRPGPAWRWTYSYSVDGAAEHEYGTGLQSLRSMLRRNFKDAEVIVSWDEGRKPRAGMYAPDGTTARKSLYNDHLSGAL